jgi:hypothetical protein
MTFTQTLGNMMMSQTINYNYNYQNDIGNNK